MSCPLPLDFRFAILAARCLTNRVRPPKLSAKLATLLSQFGSDPAGSTPTTQPTRCFATRSSLRSHSAPEWLHRRMQQPRCARAILRAHQRRRPRPPAVYTAAVPPLELTVAPTAAQGAGENAEAEPEPVRCPVGGGGFQELYAVAVLLSHQDKLAEAEVCLSDAITTTVPAYRMLSDIATVNSARPTCSDPTDAQLSTAAHHPAWISAQAVTCVCCVCPPVCCVQVNSAARRRSPRSSRPSLTTVITTSIFSDMSGAFTEAVAVLHVRRRQAVLRPQAAPCQRERVSSPAPRCTSVARYPSDAERLSVSMQEGKRTPGCPDRAQRGERRDPPYVDATPLQRPETLATAKLTLSRCAGRPNGRRPVPPGPTGGGHRQPQEVSIICGITYHIISLLPGSYRGSYRPVCQKWV